MFAIVNVRAYVCVRWCVCVQVCVCICAYYVYTHIFNSVGTSMYVCGEINLCFFSNWTVRNYTNNFPPHVDQYLISPFGISYCGGCNIRAIMFYFSNYVNSISSALIYLYFLMKHKYNNMDQFAMQWWPRFRLNG